MYRPAALSPEQARLASLLALPENHLCADCGAQAPTWASHSIGVFVCMDCSGLHRKLGTHISKVRSTTLDKWDTPSVDGMERAGNVRMNAVYEAGLKDYSRKPRPTSSLDERETFIRAKYERGLYRGAPTPDSVKRAAEQQGMPLARIPPGYIEGVDMSLLSGSSVGGSGAPAPVAKEVNPALLRRQQKKAAASAEEVAKVEADARAVQEAEAAARMAEAQKSAALAATLVDVLGKPAAAAPSPVVFDPLLRGSAPTNSDSTSGVFTSAAAPASSSSFAFLANGAGTPAPSSPPALPHLLAPHTPAPSAAGTSSFAFLSSSTASPALVPAPAVAAPLSSFSFVTAAMPASAGHAATASAPLNFGLPSSPAPGTSSAQGGAASLPPFVSAVVPAHVPASAPATTPASGFNMFSGLSAHASAPAPAPVPVASPVFTSPTLPSTPAPTPVSLPPVTVTLPENGTADAAEFQRMYESVGPLPDTVDALLARQAVLGALHAKAMAAEMHRFQARQAAMNRAYEGVINRLVQRLSDLQVSGGAHQTVSMGVHGGAGQSVSTTRIMGSQASNAAALEMAMSSLNAGVAAFDLGLATSPSLANATNTDQLSLSGQPAKAVTDSSTEIAPHVSAPSAAPGSMFAGLSTALPAPTSATAPSSGSSMFAGLGMSAPAPAPAPAPADFGGLSFSVTPVEAPASLPPVLSPQPSPQLSAPGMTSMFAGLGVSPSLPAPVSSPAPVSAAPQVGMLLQRQHTAFSDLGDDDAAPALVPYTPAVSLPPSFNAPASAPAPVPASLPAPTFGVTGFPGLHRQLTAASDEEASMPPVPPEYNTPVVDTAASANPFFAHVTPYVTPLSSSLPSTAVPVATPITTPVGALPAPMSAPPSASSPQTFVPSAPLASVTGADEDSSAFMPPPAPMEDADDVAAFNARAAAALFN